MASIDLLLRSLGSLALLAAAGVLLFRREGGLAILASALGVGTLSILAVVRTESSAAAILALVAWPAAVLAAMFLVMRTSKALPARTVWIILLPTTAAGVIATLHLARLPASSPPLFDATEKVADASLALFSCACAAIIALLAASHTQASASDRPALRRLALALAVYPSIAVGFTLLAFDLDLADLLVGGALGLAALFWLFATRGPDPSRARDLTLLLVALPIVGMLAFDGGRGDHAAQSLSRLAMAALLVWPLR